MAELPDAVLPIGVLNPSALGDKAAAVQAASEKKVQALQGMDLLRNPGPAPIQAYPDAEAYEAAGNQLDIESLRYFSDKARERALFKHELIKSDRAAREDAAWVSDSQLDTTSGQAKQLGAAGVVGLARESGHLASLPTNALVNDALNRTDDKARNVDAQIQGAKLARQDILKAKQTVAIQSLMGKITPDQQREQMAALDAQLEAIQLPSKQEQDYLNEPAYLPENRTLGDAELLTEFGRAFYRMATGQGPATQGEQLESVRENLDRGEKINRLFNENEYVKGIMNPLNREKVNKELSATWDANKQYMQAAEAAYEKGDIKGAAASAAEGIARLTVGAGGDFINNPAATFEYIAENVPQLALGAFSKTALAATNLAYGADIYRKGIEDYRQKNNGALPNQEDSAKILAVSLTASLAENVMDASILKSFKGIAPGSETVGVMTEAALKQARKSAIRRLLESSGEVAQRTATGTAGEAVTETYQTAVEENLSKLNTDFDGETLFKGGAIGGVSGGVISGTGAVASELSQGARNNLLARNATEKPSDKVDVDQVDSYLDQDNAASYDPRKGLTALLELSKKEDATPEQRQANLARATKVMERAEAEKVTAQNKAELYSAEGQAAYKQILVDKTQELEALPEDQVEARTKLAAQIEMISTALESAEKAPAAEKEKARKALLEAEKKLGEYRVIQDHLKNIVKPEGTSKEDVGALVSAINITAPVTEDGSIDPTPIPEEVQASVRKSADDLITLTMANPDVVSDDDVQAILTNNYTPVSKAQRATLEAFAEGRALAKSMSGVNSDVFNGNSRDGYVGINQYRERMATAMSVDDREGAYDQLKKLSAFVKDRRNKAKAVADAYKDRKNNQAIYLERAPDGTWNRRNKPFESEQERNSVSGLVVDGKTRNLVQTLKMEADIATAAQKQAVQAYRTKYPLEGNQQAKVSEPVAAAPQAKAKQVKAKKAAPAPKEETKQSAPKKEPVPVKQEAKVATEPKKAEPASKQSARSEQDQSQAEQQYPGIMPWESVDDYQQRVGSEPQTEQAEAPAAQAEVKAEAAPQPKAKPAPKKEPVTDKFIGEVDRISKLASARDRLMQAAQLLEKTSFDGELSAEIEDAAENLTSLAFDEKTIREAYAPIRTRLARLASPEFMQRMDDRIEALVEDMTLASEEAASSLKWMEGLAKKQDELQPDLFSGRTDGQLQVFLGEKETVTADNYLSVNLVRAFFTQNIKLPLAKTWNLLSQLAKDTSSEALNKALNREEGDRLTGDQENVLRLFIAKAQAWQSKIPSMLLRKQKTEFNYQELVQFLMLDGDKPDLDENLKTAMVHAVFTYAAENGGRLYNDKSAINSLLGRDSKHPIGPEGELFSTIGARDDVVKRNLGSRIVRNLGVKAIDGAYQNLGPQLEAHLGGYALALATDLGLLERTGYDASIFDDIEGVEPIVGKEDRLIPQFFVRIARTEEGEAIPEVQEILEAVRGTQGVLGDLVGVDTDPTEPVYKAKAFKATTTKGTREEIPERQAEILEKENQKAHGARLDNVGVIRQLSRSLVERVIGVDDTSPELLHVSNRKGVAAKNRLLREEYDNALAFFEKLEKSAKGMEQEFFFRREVWRQQRVGMLERWVNPQTSKFHRHLISMKGWRTTVKLDDQASVDNFKLAIAEAMGFKTDKQLNEKTLVEFNDWLEQDDVQAAITAMYDLHYLEHPSPAGEAAIAALLDGKQGMFSLDALVQLAHYKHALDSGEKDASFVTYLFREVDGKTNGPILGIWQLGAAYDSNDLFGWLNKGGIYTQNDPHKTTHYSDYRRRKGSADLYETLSKSVVDYLAGSKIAPEVLQSIYGFISKKGKLVDDEGNVNSDGRNLVKQPLTSMVFGAGINKTVDNMALAFIQKIHDKIQELSLKDPEGLLDGPERAALIDSINVLLSERNQLNNKMTMEDLRELDLSKLKGVKQDLIAAYTNTIGAAVGSTLRSRFAQFLEIRGTLNNAAQVSFELYDIAFKQLKAKKIAELMEAEGPDRLPHRIVGKGKNEGQKVPVADLKKEHLDEIREQLKDLYPLVHTPLSKLSNNIKAGLHLAKQGRGISDDPAYQSQLMFGRPVEGVGKNMTVKGYATEGVNPGVAALIMMIHSGDSAISSLAYEMSQALNIHDAHGLGLWEVIEGAKRLNENTYKVMRDYSAPNELAETLARSINAFAALVRDGVLDPEAIENKDLKGLDKVLGGIQKNLEKEYPAKAENFAQSPLGYFMYMVKQTAYQSDKTRLNTTKQIGAVDQYSLEGGQYMVTDQDRAVADDLLAALSPTIDPELIDNANELSRVLLKDENPTVEPDQPAVPAFSASSILTQTPYVLLNEIDAVLEQPELEPEIDSVLRKIKQIVMDRFMTLQEALVQVNKQEAALATAVLVNGYKPKAHSVWGKLGTPVIKSDLALVKAFQAKPVMTVAEVEALLRERMKDNRTNFGTVQLRLLRAVAKLAGTDVKVQYVTSETGPDQAMGKDVTGARGWFASLGGTDTIYVKSPEFVESGLTAELLLHELTHAALMHTIIRAKKAGKGDAFQLVKDLEGLLETARAHVKSDKKLADRFTEAVKNVDELISWGMTNQGFQDLVLKKITYESSDKATKSRGKLIDGMKAFIKAIHGLLFPDSVQDAETDTNGLAVLISDVSGLMVAASKQRKGRKPSDDLIVATMNAGSEAVVNMAPMELLEALESADTTLTDTRFKAHLNQLLESLTDKLDGPFGTFRMEAAQKQAILTEDMFLQALSEGKLPFASSTLASHIPLSQPEAYVFEQVHATVQALLDNPVKEAGPVIRALQKLYKESHANVKVEDFHDGDWSKATPDEKERAKAQYEHTFAATTEPDQFLARFAALALASKTVRDKLDFKTKTISSEKSGNKIVDAVMVVFEKILSIFNGRLIKAYGGQMADAKAQTLVEQLVSIDARYKREQARPESPFMRAIEDSTRTLSDTAASKVKKMVDSHFAKDTKNALVSLGMATLGVAAQGRVNTVMHRIQQIRNRNFKTQQGLMTAALTELAGMNEGNSWGHVLLQLANYVEQQREQIKEQVGFAALQSFANVKGKKNGAGTHLTKEHKKALTTGVLRTDLQSLYGEMTLDEIQDLILNPEKVNTWIAKLEAAIPAKNRDHLWYVINQSKLTGLQMATGRVVYEGNMMMNAHNIASMFASKEAGKVDTQYVADLEKAIDPLISLYAFKNTASKDILALQEVVRIEQERTDGGNGLEATMLLHRSLQVDSEARLFQGSKALMQKGYVPEVYNPNIEILVADAKTGAGLIKAGYSEGKPVALDPADPDQEPKRLYKVRSGGLRRFVSGAMSLTDRHTQGSTAHSGVSNNYFEGIDARNQRIQNRMLAQKRAATNKLFTMDPAQFDPFNTDLFHKSYMAPVMNPNGTAVNYRYLMREDVKDDLLERNNSFDVLLGTFASSTFDKDETPKQNRTVVEAMRAFYDQDYRRHSERFVKVGPNSTDPEMVERWAMLPEATKQDIKEVWNSDSLYVPVDMLDMFFGYRVPSISDAVALHPKQRALHEKLIINTVLSVVKRNGGDEKRAALRIRQGEDIWQTFVTEAKDIFVVRTGMTLIGNVLSNWSLLLLAGVNPIAQLKHHRIALMGALDYRRDRSELRRLETMRNAGYLGSKDITRLDQEIAVLEDALKRNPVRELIEAGLLPTIVEDVGAIEDDYSYKALLAHKMEPITDRIPQPLKTAASVVLISRDTSLYKAMSQATQLSDFLARYTLVQHLTTRKRNPLNRADALKRATESFVNYDVPTHRTIEYLNRMGLLMFTKYYMRIQKVLLDQARENPARMIALLAAEYTAPGLQTVADSAAVANVGNPLDAGAFEIFDALKSLPIIRAVF